MSKWCILSLFLISYSALNAQSGGIYGAHYHEHSNEVSTHLRFKNTTQIPDNYSEILLTSIDSIIMDKDYVVRKRLSPIAFDYFDTTGYSKMVYINEKSELIGTLKFKHFEYQDDELEAYFKAVFSIEKASPNVTVNYHIDQYAITSSLLPFFTEDFESSTLSSKIELSPSEEAKIGFRSEDIIDGSLIEYGTFNTLYVVSLGNYTQETWHSKIISNTDLTQALFKDYSQFIFYEAHAIPLIINGFPILFCNKGKPDTDWRWSEFMYFNGTQFITAEDGLVPLPQQK